MNGDIEHQNLNGNSIKEGREAPNENSQVLDSKFKVAFPTWWLRDRKGKKGCRQLVYGAFNILPSLSYRRWKFLYWGGEI